MTQQAASAVAVAGPAAPGGLPGWPEPGRCLVMGVVAVAPAEFPGGGKAFRLEQAVARGMELMQAGADLIEVAGGSPHRGAAPLPLAEQIESGGEVRARSLPMAWLVLETHPVGFEQIVERVADEVVRAQREGRAYTGELTEPTPEHA